MKHSKIIAGLGSVVAAALLLAGCSAGPGAAPTAEAATGTLKFVMDNPGWKTQFEQMNKQSEKDVKIDVKIAGYSDQNQYKAVVKQLFRTKDAPGLFKWQVGAALDQLVEQGLVADTSKIWKTAIANGEVSADLAKTYTVDGKQYCVPLNVAYWGFYYNKHVFEKYGITVPDTWKELMAAADKLKDKGVTPFFQTSTGFTYPWFTTVVAGEDPKLYAELGAGKAKFTGPTVVKAMNAWLDQEQKGYFTSAGSKVDDAAAMLKRGDMAMMNMGTWFGSSFTGAGMTSDDYGFFPIPAMNASLKKTPVPVETAPVCVSEKSPQKALGMAYSEWLMTANAGSTWSAANGDVPFNPKAKIKDPAIQALAKQLSSSKYETVPRFFDMMPSAPMEVARGQFSQFAVNPSNPKPFLEAIQNAMDASAADGK